MPNTIFQALFAKTSQKKSNICLAFFDNQFAANVKNNNKTNNAITIIEELVMNIKYKSFYKKLIEKIIHETCGFFIYFAKPIISKAQIAFCGIKLVLKLF